MDVDRLRTILKSFADKRILVIGDLMLDRFLWGEVSRISPEAPVPVVQVESEELYPGGAANVARNLLPFAASVGVVGQIGDDPEGDQLLALLEEAGLDSRGVQRTGGNPTTVKTRVVARNQQVVRIDREQYAEPTAEQIQRTAAGIAERLPEIDAIVLQDYGKGFLTQDFVDRLAELAGDSGPVVTVDPNPNNAINWRGATAIKPNRHEAFRFAGLPEAALADLPSEDPLLREVAGQLFERWGTRHLLITLGEQGMVLCDRGAQSFTHIPPRAHEVFDVSGAGDTAIALFTLALAAGAPPVEAAEISNWASAVVVGKVGTATLTPEELVEACTR